jgi:large subunit ribosomal protein L21
MYAVIQNGGKQYKVEEGQRLKLEKMDVEEGETVDLGHVLMISGQDGEARIGTPELEDAAVRGRVVRHGKGPKLTMMRYRGSKNWRSKKGHRQPYTAVEIEEIEQG